MADVRQYWGAVKDTASRLTEENYYLMSLDEPSRGSVGDVISQVPKAIAARLIVDKTHRVATEAEVAKYLSVQEVTATENAKKERERLLATNPLVAALADQTGAKPKK